jgi:hypothetical protein
MFHLFASCVQRQFIFLVAVKEREKIHKQQVQQKMTGSVGSASGSRAASPSPVKTPKGGRVAVTKSGAATPSRPIQADNLDLAALNLLPKEMDSVVEEPPKMRLERERLLDEARASLLNERKSVSIVIIGTSRPYDWHRICV